MNKNITRRQALEILAAAPALLSAPSSAGNRGVDETGSTALVRRMLEQTVGARDKVAGTVGVVIDESGASRVACGSSGVPNVVLDAHTVFEIGSITKVFTALMLTDMAARGDVALDDPLEKYLPPSVRLHERGRPITLLDFANYNAGLPLVPGNLPPNWWESPNPFADYTVDKLYEFVSGYTPEYVPGTRFEYSSFGFGLLGLALARRARNRCYRLRQTQRCVCACWMHCAVIGLARSS